MKVNLSQIQESVIAEKGKNTLDLKFFLTQQKKEGLLFFQEKMSDLKDNTLFELYFYLTSSPKSTINAFPIPIQDFQFYKDMESHFDFIRKYFESYYLIHINDLNFFAQYNYKRPYVGTKYLWYFKNT